MAAPQHGSSEAQRTRKAELRQLWESLEESERQRISSLVRQCANSDHVRKAIDAGKLDDTLVELQCLKIVEAESMTRKAGNAEARVWS